MTYAQQKWPRKGSKRLEMTYRRCEIGASTAPGALAARPATLERALRIASSGARREPWSGKRSWEGGQEPRKRRTPTVSLTKTSEKLSEGDWKSSTWGWSDWRSDRSEWRSDWGGGRLLDVNGVYQWL